MKTVSARMEISIYVNCPHCDELLDLMDQDDTDGCDHNEEGYLLNQACPIDGSYWMDAHRKFEVEKVTCFNCKKDFDVKTLDW